MASGCNGALEADLPADKGWRRKFALEATDPFREEIKRLELASERIVQFVLAKIAPPVRGAGSAADVVTLLQMYFATLNLPTPRLFVHRLCASRKPAALRHSFAKLEKESCYCRMTREKESGRVVTRFRMLAAELRQTNDRTGSRGRWRVDQKGASICQ